MNHQIGRHIRHDAIHRRFVGQIADHRFKAGSTRGVIGPHQLGVVLVTLIVLGLLFVWATVDLGRDPTEQRSMRVFAYSITYVTLLFAALTVDVFVRHGLEAAYGG